MKIFKTGFMGASLDEITVWCHDRSEGAQRICVPYAGSGKDIASMAQRNPGAEIHSWDPQFLSYAVIDGIFAAKAPETNIDGIRARKGVMFEERPLKNMDDETAGFFDWVAKNGTLYDKAALSSATVRSTMIGRMTHWDPDGDVYALAHKVELAKKRQEEWVGMDAKFVHTMGSFHESANLPTGKYDLVQVDSPKVVGSRDVYSVGGFAGMNRALGGPEIPVWKKDDVIARFREVLELDAERILFLYVSEVKPTFQEVKRLLEEYGTIEEEKEFDHGKRFDIAWMLRKDSNA